MTQNVQAYMYVTLSEVYIVLSYVLYSSNIFLHPLRPCKLQTTPLAISWRAYLSQTCNPGSLEEVFTCYTDTETGIRFWGKENIRMKGKGRHFFEKSNLWRRFLSITKARNRLLCCQCKKISPHLLLPYRKSKVASVDLRFYLEKKV